MNTKQLSIINHFVITLYLKRYSTFLEIGSFDNSPARVKQFLVSLTIVYFFLTIEVNETRNRLFTDILLNIRKSAEWI